jgi:hypothetical protein
MSNQYLKFISKMDLAVLLTEYTEYIEDNVDLMGKTLWIFFKSSYKLDKDYKFNKHIDNNLIQLSKYIINGKRSYISNTIIDKNTVIIWYKTPEKPEKLTFEKLTFEKLTFEKLIEKKFGNLSEYD